MDYIRRRRDGLSKLRERQKRRSCRQGIRRAGTVRCGRSRTTWRRSSRRRWGFLTRAQALAHHAGRGADAFSGCERSSFLSKSRSIELKLGQVVLWKRPEDRGRIWLLLPVSVTAGEGCVAMAGFRTRSGGATGGELERRVACAARRSNRCGGGRSAPRMPLRRGGSRLLSRLLTDGGARLVPAAAPRSRDEESERVVIGRLIRRLRISDPPQHFQTVATTVLRWSLNMAAVAWVPRAEASRWSGAARCQASTARPIVLCPRRPGASRCWSSTASAPRRSIGVPPSVRRFASVAAGSLGYLVAVNPLADRPIVRADVERLQFVASLIATQVSNVKIYADLKELLFGIIRGLTTAIDAKDTYTSGHSERVARIAVRLGQELGMPAAKLSDLYLAGLLHDVGKIGIDDVVLEEVRPAHARGTQEDPVARRDRRDDPQGPQDAAPHLCPAYGTTTRAWTAAATPTSSRANEIPFEARILAVADAFDAMSNNRPYRNRLSLAQIDRDPEGRPGRPVGPAGHRRPLRLPQRPRGDRREGRR